MRMEVLVEGDKDCKHVRKGWTLPNDLDESSDGIVSMTFTCLKCGRKMNQIVGVVSPPDWSVE